MSLKQITRISILAALAFVLRLTFSHLPNIQPVTAMFLALAILSSYYEAILVMSVCMLTSSFLLGFGPWVFWQITTFSFIIFLWHYVLYPLSKKMGKKAMLFQCLFTALLALIYGIIIDSFFTIIYQMPWWSYILAGMPFNLMHALSTLLFYPIFIIIFRRFAHGKLF